MATPTVIIAGNEYDVYGSLDDANIYMAAAAHADCWRPLDDDPKARALVTSSRLLDRQRWRGTKTDPDQPLDWPRTGTGVEGVVNDAIPLDIQNASFELALALLDGSDVQNEPNVAPKLQSIRAGSVALTYYHGFQPSIPARFPQIVQELLRDYLDLGSSTLSGVATGVDGTSVTENDFGLNRGL